MHDLVENLFSGRFGGGGHVGIGRAHARTRVVLLVADRDVRVLTLDGELLRHLQIDPTRDYQRLGPT